MTRLGVMLTIGCLGAAFVSHGPVLAGPHGGGYGRHGAGGGYYGGYGHHGGAQGHYRGSYGRYGGFGGFGYGAVGYYGGVVRYPGGTAYGYFAAPPYYGYYGASPYYGYSYPGGGIYYFDRGRYNGLSSPLGFRGSSFGYGSYGLPTYGFGLGYGGYYGGGLCP